MTRLAVVAAQAGAGRTILASNLGAALARLGHKVMLVDADPASKHKPSEDPFGPKAKDLGDGVCMQAATAPGLHGMRITYHAAKALQDKSPDEATALLKAWGEGCEFVLVDAPTAGGPDLQRILGAVDRVLVPVEVASDSLTSLPETLRAILEAQQEHPRLALEGLIINRAPADGRHATRDGNALATFELIEEEFGELCFKESIPWDPSFTTTPHPSEPLACTAPMSAGGRAFERLAAEVSRRILRTRTPSAAATRSLPTNLDPVDLAATVLELPQDEIAAIKDAARQAPRTGLVARFVQWLQNLTSSSQSRK